MSMTNASQYKSVALTFWPRSVGVDRFYSGQARRSKRARISTIGSVRSPRIVLILLLLDVYIRVAECGTIFYRNGKSQSRGTTLQRPLSFFAGCGSSEATNEHLAHNEDGPLKTTSCSKSLLAPTASTTRFSQHRSRTHCQSTRLIFPLSDDSGALLDVCKFVCYV